VDDGELWQPNVALRSFRLRVGDYFTARSGGVARWRASNDHSCWSAAELGADCVRCRVPRAVVRGGVVWRHSGDVCVQQLFRVRGASLELYRLLQLSGAASDTAAASDADTSADAEINTGADAGTDTETNTSADTEANAFNANACANTGADTGANADANAYSRFFAHYIADATVLSVASADIFLECRFDIIVFEWCRSNVSQGVAE
jgi:hypothetical protein